MYAYIYDIYIYIIYRGVELISIHMDGLGKVGTRFGAHNEAHWQGFKIQDPYVGHAGHKPYFFGVSLHPLF